MAGTDVLRCAAGDVNKSLNCNASDYAGQIANLQQKYSNCICAVFDDVSVLYRCDEGQFTYVCTLGEAMRI